MKHRLPFAFFFAGLAFGHQPKFEIPAYETPLPMRFEMGTYHNYGAKDCGYWRGIVDSIYQPIHSDAEPVLPSDRFSQAALRSKSLLKAAYRSSD